MENIAEDVEYGEVTELANLEEGDLFYAMPYITAPSELRIWRVEFKGNHRIIAISLNDSLDGVGRLDMRPSRNVQKIIE